MFNEDTYIRKIVIIKNNNYGNFESLLNGGNALW